MAGDGITTFFGEFLANPIALEWSGNFCSHGCPYCFANLNSLVRTEKKGVPLRYADVRGVVRLLAEMRQRRSLEAFWLLEGHPILVSNKVDPFSQSNWRSAVPLMEIMTEMAIPIAIQTRGGYGVDEALEFLKPSVWYVSIDHADDATRHAMAPRNPSMESRYDLIAKVIERGHKVVIGLNPLTIEWLPEPGPVLQRCKDLGAWGVWIELLHLNKDQAAIARKQGVMPESMLQRYETRRKTEPESFRHFVRTRQIAREVGLEVYSIAQCTPSKYFDVYKQVYSQLLPTLQDWVNYCWEQGWQSDRLIRFDEFAQFFEPLLPVGEQRFGHYVASVCHDIPAQKGRSWSNWMTARELLRWSWNDPRLKWCPVRSPGFAYVPELDWQPKDKLQKLRRDANGDLYMAFWPEYDEFLMEEV